jgi:Na+-transporting methylmalonyl-CoA/oxaloacetate decarboxylase gamma subunit
VIDGLTITLVGMLVVLGFLVLMVGAMKMLAAVAARLAPPAAPRGGASDAEIAAIAAALRAKGALR